MKSMYVRLVYTVLVLVPTCLVCQEDCLSKTALQTQDLPTHEVQQLTEKINPDVEELIKKLDGVQRRMDLLECAQQIKGDQHKDNTLQSIIHGKNGLQKFIRDNGFALVSTACTLIGLYLSYYFNNELLKINRASFLLANTEVALRDLSLVAAGKYAQYRSNVQSARGMLAI